MVCAILPMRATGTYSSAPTETACHGLGQRDAVTARQKNPMYPRRICCAEQCSEVLRVLNAVKEEQKRILAAGTLLLQ